jgi:chitinase
MRNSLTSIAGVICVFAFASTGCSTSSPSASPSPSLSPSPSTVAYAPYVSATEASDTDSAGSPSTYNLAFVISDGSGCTPKWNGPEAIGDSAVKSRIARLKKDGAGVRVSFGGASGKELAATCDSVAELAAAYGRALDAAGSERAVNLMTMNYGESYAGDMGDYAVTSAEAAHAQLMKVFGLSDAGAWRGMALTSMIGVNDVDGETFTLSDAARVRTFAEEKEITWVSMWSTFRDRRCTAGDSGADDAATNCSGVSQSSGAFGEAFAG